MNVAVAKTGKGRAVSDLFTSAEGRLPGSPAVIAPSYQRNRKRSRINRVEIKMQSPIATSKAWVANERQ